MGDTTENKHDIIVLKFADSKVPVFKESRDKDYIKYGEDNAYPEYLTYLFNKSAKHNAILTGKANYIFGKGYENGLMPVNRLGETLNDVSRKCVLDTEIYGGFRLEVIWNRVGRISEIYHVDYSTVRLAKDGGYYFADKWEKYTNHDILYIPAFNPSSPQGSQLYAYNEYRPGVRFYPLPSYIGCNNYVETDIEISKFYLSSIRNGMMPSKMIQFFKGEPTEEKKKEIEKRMAQKFAGPEQAGNFMLVFNDANEQKQLVKVDDLSGTELDKMFIELNKTTQQEIFSGHLVTSPMLFGIKTEGQLGGTTELKTAYEIFINTYAEPKAQAYDREINYLLGFSVFAGKYEITQTDPIGLQFEVKDVVASLPKEFIFDQLGIPKEFWGTPTAQPATPAPGEMTNDAIKNLTGRQHQAVMRIIRQYGQSKITLAQAKTLLRTGYGLGENDINLMLGLDEQPITMSAHEPSDDAIIAMFDECGDSKDDYEVIRTKAAFSTDDEDVWMAEAFKTYDVTATESLILELIKKDSKITAAVIATSIKQTEAYVTSKIASLTKRGYLEAGTELIGADEVIVRTVPKIDILKPPPGKTNPALISIKYSYEGPQDSKNRPFCAKLLQLNRLYSRAEIERISERLGYSVFDRRGGFWTRKGTNTTTPYCRHKWQSQIVVKKGGNVS
jgi:hypothetical protein